MSAVEAYLPSHSAWLSQAEMNPGALPAVIPPLVPPSAIPLAPVSDWLDVRQDGVQCDGATDDTPALARALARGKPLQLPVGTCLVNSLTLAKGAHLIMQGAGMGRTVLKHQAQASAALLSGPGAGASAAYVSLRDLTLDGNKAQQTDWELNLLALRVDHAAIERIECRHSKRACIVFQQINHAAVIRDSWFHDMAQHGPADADTHTIIATKESMVGPAATSRFFALNNVLEMHPAPTRPGDSVGGIFVTPHEGQNQAATIIGNTLVNIGQEMLGNTIGAIQCYRSCDNSVVLGNVLRHIYTQGIHWQRSSNVLIAHNVIEGGPYMHAGRYGIGVSNRKPVTVEANLKITGNIIRDLPLGYKCIAVFNNQHAATSNVDITYNTCDTMQAGIDVREVEGTLNILGNTVRNMRQAQLQARRCFHVQSVGDKSAADGVSAVINVKDNVCQHGDAGLYLLNVGGDITVANNLFEDLKDKTDFRYSAIALETLVLPSRVTITNNRFSGIQQRGIFLDDGVARRVQMIVAHNYFADTGLSLVTGSAVVVVRRIDSLLMHDNVWHNMPVADRLLDLATIPRVNIHDNLYNGSETASLAWHTDVGSVFLRHAGNSWGHDCEMAPSGQESRSTCIPTRWHVLP